MANLNEPLAVEDYDATELGLNRSRRAAFLVTTKVETPTEKGLHRQMVDNNAARNKIEELLLEVNATSEDFEVGSNAKFIAAKKLKLQQFLRSALKDNNEQNMFLKLALESGYEAAEAIKSVGGPVVYPGQATTLPWEDSGQSHKTSDQGSQLTSPAACAKLAKALAIGQELPAARYSLVG